MQLFTLAAIAFPIMLVLDLLWIGVIGAGFYRSQLGSMLRPDVVWPAALAFYVIYAFAIAFFVLMLLGAGGWPGRGGRIAVGLSAYGLLIEICQHTLTTNRFGDPWDWVADSVGVLLGWLLVRRAARGAVASA